MPAESSASAERPANAQIKQCTMGTYPVVLASTVGGRCGSLWVTVGRMGRRRVWLFIIELVAIKHEINFRAAGSASRKNKMSQAER